VRRELAELRAVVGQPLQFTVAREQAAEAAASEAGPAALRVRASVEDAPASATRRLHPDAS
jgi:hypothetical protein